jgi:uncharacterized membrane protein YbhN (UPF0104 family)
MNPRHYALLRVVISAALLALAWRLVDGSAVLQLLRTIDTGLLFIAVAITVPMHILSALRWQFTCARIGVRMPLRDALGEYYLASMLNTVLPGGVTGDAARVWRQAERQQLPRAVTGTGQANATSRYSRPLHGVIVERLAGQCALFAVLAAGMVVNYQRLAPLLDVLLALGAVLALIAIAWSVLAVHASAEAPAPERVLWRWPWRAALREFHADAQRALWPLPVLLVQAALSLAVVASYLATFWIAAQAVHAPLDLASGLLVVPLVLTAMTLPVSFGGLGLRETTAAVVWPVLALCATDGAASALTYGLVILIGALPGLAVLLTRRMPASR